jgi:hypothetical protein
LITALTIGCASKPNPLPQREPDELSTETRRILDGAESFTLYAIGFPERKDYASTDDTVFHGYTISGKAELADEQDRKELLESLYKGISENKVGRAICFEPAYGVSAKLGEEKVDLVICFACYGVDVYSKNEKSVATTDSPLETWKRIFKKVGLNPLE